MALPHLGTVSASSLLDRRSLIPLIFDVFCLLQCLASALWVLAFIFLFLLPSNLRCRLLAAGTAALRGGQGQGHCGDVRHAGSSA